MSYVFIVLFVTISLFLIFFLRIPGEGEREIHNLLSILCIALATMTGGANYCGIVLLITWGFLLPQAILLTEWSDVKMSFTELYHPCCEFKWTWGGFWHVFESFPTKFWWVYFLLLHGKAGMMMLLKNHYLLQIRAIRNWHVKLSHWKSITDKSSKPNSRPIPYSQFWA